MLSPNPDHPALAWREIDGQLIFLDVAADRYFRLGEKETHAFLDMLGQTGRAWWRQPPGFPLPSDWAPPLRTDPAIEQGSFNLAEVARLMWIQRRVQRRLATGGFHSVLSDTRRLIAARAIRPHVDRPRAASVIRACEHARVLRTAANRCLARSIALALRLAASGTPVTLVIGVKLAPFGAHCWAQCGEAVVSDSVEEVQRYSPLLVL